MAATARIYTPAQAAAVSGIGIKAVHNAIDKKIVEGRKNIRGTASRRHRTLTDGDLLRLKLWYGVGSALSADRRERLFEAIKAEPAAATVKADDFLIVDVNEARRQLRTRVEALDEAEAMVHSVQGIMDGEPVYKATRIPVRMMAAMLLQGAGMAELLEGYPKLTVRMIELSQIWAAAHPPRGRPKTLEKQGFQVVSKVKVALPPDPLP